MRQRPGIANRLRSFEVMECRILLAADLMVEVDDFDLETPGDAATRTVRVYNNGDTDAVDAIVRSELTDQLTDTSWMRTDGLAKIVRGRIVAPEIVFSRTPIESEDVAFGDIDGDGQLDRIRNEPISPSSSAYQTVIDYGDDQSISVAKQTSFVVPVGDVNADSEQDFMMNHPYQGFFSLMLGGSSPKIVPVTSDILKNQLIYSPIAFGDVTGDGVDDVVMYLSGRLGGDSTASDNASFPVDVGVAVIPGAANLGSIAEFDLRRDGILFEVTTPFFARIDDFTLADLNGDAVNDIVIRLSQEAGNVHDYVVFGGPDLQSLDFGMQTLSPLNGENGFAAVRSGGRLTGIDFGERVQSGRGDIFDRVTIPAGQSIIYTVNGLVREDAAPTIDSSAVAGNGLDENFDDNADAKSVVHLSSSLTHTDLSVGQEATFEVTIENLAPNTASQVQIMETISETLVDSAWKLRTLDAFSPEIAGLQTGPKAIGLFRGELSGSLGDINGDGADDFFVTTQTVIEQRLRRVADVYLGGGDFSSLSALEDFDPKLRIVGAAAIEQMFALGDWDGDGFDDFFVDDGESQRIIFGQSFSQSEGMLTQNEFRSENLAFTPITEAISSDLNADGIDDLVEIEGQTLNVVLGSEEPATTPGQTLSITPTDGFLPQTFTVGDFNGDGVEDLVIGSDNNDFFSGEVSINFGGQSFPNAGRVVWETVGTSFLIHTPANTPGRMILSTLDVNGDGTDDLLLTNTADGPVQENGWFSGSMQIVQGKESSNIVGTGMIEQAVDIAGTVGRAIYELTGTVTEATLANPQYINLIPNQNQYQLDSTQTTIELEASSQLSGDIDGNGIVDFGDFLILAHNFGKRDAEPAEGDINRDRIIDLTDFLLLGARFGVPLAN